jgi:GDP-mannose 4,6 dehydratase
VRHTVCTRATGSYSTMKVHEEAGLSWLGRFRGQLQIYHWVNKGVFILEISMLVVIGVMVSSLVASTYLSRQSQSIPSCFAAKDYVEGMWLMLQQPNPDDFVLATGETHKVREFVNKSFNAVGIQLKYVSLLWFFCPLILLNPRWEGSGEDEHAIDISNGKIVVKVDPAYFRPAEVEYVFFKKIVTSGMFFHDCFS